MAGEPVKTEIGGVFAAFTDRSRHIMALANQAAHWYSHEYIGTEHILIGVVKEGSGVAANVLKMRGIHYERLKAEIERVITKGPSDLRASSKLTHTPRAKRIIEFAIKNAEELGDTYIGTEHLLLGILDEKDGVAAQVILNMGLTLETARADTLRLLDKDDPRMSDDAQVDVKVEEYQEALREAVVLSRDMKIDITAAFAQVMAKWRGHV